MVYSIKIPRIKRSQKTNLLGLTFDDYKGTPSTLCGGCGHDAISTCIMQACYELSIPPQDLVKLSGIGCSSKTPAYFVNGAHAFNAVHGRMACIATGAHAAHKGLEYLAVSGDGDTANIGLGSFLHSLRRDLRMTYIVENNGVFGLTKGQFSTTAEKGTRDSKGRIQQKDAIDLVTLAIQCGASFVGRSFSANKEHFLPLLKEAMQHDGFAVLDVISPCISFNNHEGSSRSYASVREHEGDSLQKPFAKRWDALAYCHQIQEAGRIPMGCIYKEDLEPLLRPKRPLRDIPLSELSPELEELEVINNTLR